VIALDAPRTSAQNVLPGRVVRIAEISGRIRVTVDAGVELDVDLTPGSTRDLGLEVGKAVHAVFKAHSVKVIPVS
jgi:molybdopterin-binding protein